jgi:hypothetical protein
MITHSAEGSVMHAAASAKRSAHDVPSTCTSTLTAILRAAAHRVAQHEARTVLSVMCAKHDHTQ